MENKSVCYSGEKNVKHGKSKFFGSTAGGISSARYGVVNKLYDEEKFHGRQGHGFAAERANNLFDKITGHHAKIVGDDNVKNGADRVVDGVFIQSKYCQTGLACINECFDGKGNFRYLKNGKPMQIEVPSDKYDAAVEAMQEKIRKGKIPGVTDPDEAKNIVRKGHFTHEQAKNIAKAGTVESLTYDAVNGAIIATSAFGVTTIITLATNLWNGEDFENSLKIATFSGMKVGGTAFVTTIIASQLSKAGLNSALVGSSEAIVSFMGPKASAVLVNAFRSGSNIYGAAAMKSAAKLLRGNVITSSVTVVILSSVDIAFPTIYRIDRIKEIKALKEKFVVPYKDRFQEGEFRKKVQFMYGGRLRKIRFKYSGCSIEAVLDRLPTAQIISEEDGIYTLSAEVFGEGIDMWIRSQGDAIQIIE